MRVSKLRILIHHSCEAKVSYFDIFARVKEDVARLQVSMQYFLRSLLVTGGYILYHGQILSAMALIKSEGDLH